VNIWIAALLALVLLLAPKVSGLPDEPLWSSWLAALVMLTGVLAVLKRKGSAPQTVSFSASPAVPWQGAGLFFGLLVLWALASVAAAVLHRHSAGFLGLMLRGWAVLAVQFTLFALARRLAQVNGSPFWIVVLGLVAGAAVIAAQGANEYAVHVRAGEPGWRVFASSTPDYLAGYLVMLLPLTLAVLLAVRAGGAVSLLLGLVAALELSVMLTTGSRFALVSLVAGLAAMGAALGFALRRGLVLEPQTRRRLTGMAVVLVLAGLAAAKPVLSRLLTTHAADNSAAFRVWTWRGAWHMAFANPLFGAGIGAWVQTYPRYALTGFTRLAHSGYLQMADECGLVGLAALLATLSAAAAAVARGLSRSAAPFSLPASVEQTPRRKGGKRSPAAIPPPRPPSLLDTALPADPRLLLCGLAGSLAVGVTQNLIDSDWSVFFFGVSFWAIAGLAVGTAERGQTPAPARPVSPAARTLAGLGAAGLTAYFACQGVGALLGAAARLAPTPQEAETDYQIARAWDPLNAAYPAELGYRVYARQSRLPAAEAMLRQAVALKPDAVNYRRLGTVLLVQGKTAQAQGAWERGLAAEPQSLDLLLALAGITPPPSNLAYYRTIARLETSPVGTVRAIGGITEPRFAVADAALGDDPQATPAEAQAFYARAARGLEAFASEDGSTNPQRQAMQGSQTDPAQDAQMRALHAHVMDRLLALAPANQRALLAQERQETLARYDALLPKPLNLPPRP